jgi:hypothetical protein
MNGKKVPYFGAYDQLLHTTYLLPNDDFLGLLVLRNFVPTLEGCLVSFLFCYRASFGYQSAYLAPCTITVGRF